MIVHTAYTSWEVCGYRTKILFDYLLLTTNLDSWTMKLCEIQFNRQILWYCIRRVLKWVRLWDDVILVNIRQCIQLNSRILILVSSYIFRNFLILLGRVLWGSPHVTPTVTVSLHKSYFFDINNVYLMRLNLNSALNGVSLECKQQIISRSWLISY